MIVTTVPPASGPVAGSRLSIVGAAGPSYVKTPALVTLWPSGVSTVSATAVPPGWAGLTAVSTVELRIVTWVAACSPNRTVVPATNPLPVTVTVVPPASGPLGGSKPSNASTGGPSYVNVVAVVRLCPSGRPTASVTTVFGGCGGATAVRTSPLRTLTAALATVPNRTVVPAVKPVPSTVTTVPPCAGPVSGEKELTVNGVGATKVNAAAAVALVPSRFSTVTLATPAACGGVTAVRTSSLRLSMLSAAMLSNSRTAPLRKFVPVMVTGVPPAIGPLLGTTAMIVGAFGPTNSNCPVAAVRRPSGISTVTFARPAGCGGVTAVRAWSEAMSMDAASVSPKNTSVPSAKPVPRMVTGVPPSTDPLVGVNVATDGMGGGSNVNPESTLTRRPSGRTSVTATTPSGRGGVTVVRRFAPTKVVCGASESPNKVTTPGP